MNLREAAEMALDWFDGCQVNGIDDTHEAAVAAAEALRKALAQPVDGVNISAERVDETAKGEQEWVGLTEKEIVELADYCAIPHRRYEIPIPKKGVVQVESFTARLCEFASLVAQQKREWVGLTDEEVIKCFDSVAFGQVEDDLIINKHVNIFRAIHCIEAKLRERNT